MSTSTVANHYTRILSLWPQDALRPNSPFTRTIEKRGLPFGVQPLPPSDPSVSKEKPSIAAAKPSSPPSPQSEAPQINALYTLLEDRYSKKYPLSPAVFRPTSNPEYYDRLMAEIERAPQKSWLQAKLDEWKLKIRWQ
ncbi:hypothetical protein P280DRAFT_517717 [Massarina eburnea CBS 473.64]|uniref:Uncharacterized protein n=1 Tax=Massarina eburnea CBS 473.64 TaxID=1395130 RepID=A0A6A6S1S7_9PLEO|nr:hypothetical protein P280DRAFT_517717 [Massarina eburnea CBS 473.64]